jgi:hypothetical protein
MLVIIASNTSTLSSEMNKKKKYMRIFLVRSLSWHLCLLSLKKGIDLELDKKGIGMKFSFLFYFQTKN